MDPLNTALRLVVQIRNLTLVLQVAPVELVTMLGCLALAIVDLVVGVPVPVRI